MSQISTPYLTMPFLPWKVPSTQTHPLHMLLHDSRPTTYNASCHLFQYCSSPQTVFKITPENYEEQKQRMYRERTTHLQVFLQQAFYPWKSYFSTTPNTTNSPKTCEQIFIMSIITIGMFLLLGTFHLITGFYFLNNTTNALNKNYNFFTQGMRGYGINTLDLKMLLDKQCISGDSFEDILNHKLPFAMLTPHQSKPNSKSDVKYRSQILSTRANMEHYLLELINIANNMESTEDDVKIAFIFTIVSEYTINKHRLNPFEASFFLQQMKYLKENIQINRMIRREKTNITTHNFCNFLSLLTDIQKESAVKAHQIANHYNDPSLYKHIYQIMLQQSICNPLLLHNMENFVNIVSGTLSTSRKDTIQKQHLDISQQLFSKLAEHDTLVAHQSEKEDSNNQECRQLVCAFFHTYNNLQSLSSYNAKSTSMEKESIKVLLLFWDQAIHNTQNRMPPQLVPLQEKITLLKKLQIEALECQNATPPVNTVLTSEQSIALFKILIGTGRSSAPGFPTFLDAFMHILDKQGDLDTHTNIFKPLGINKRDIEELLEETDDSTHHTKVKRFKLNIDRNTLLSKIKNNASIAN